MGPWIGVIYHNMLLMGAFASEPSFRRAVGEAFAGSPSVIQDVINPTFAAALGAAELAKGLWRGLDQEKGRAWSLFDVKS